MDFRDECVRVGPSACGLGVFSLRAFQNHELIGPIAGTVVDDPLYASEYCMAIGEYAALEPAAPFRYMNHSCHPNCALVELEIEREDGSTAPAELWVETLDTIAPGEQLTIDYGWPAEVAIPCRCGCADCRGWVVADDDLDRITGVLPAKASKPHP
ncbi:MAG: SET domain-containing protein [Thermoguttaceae bacterium]